METLLGIVSLGQSIYGMQLLHKMLSHVVMIAAVVIAVSMTAAASLIACLYAGYLEMLHLGADTQTAALVIGGVSAALTIGLIMLALSHMKRLTVLPYRLMKEKKSSAAVQVAEAADAFLEGFLRDDAGSN